MDVESSSLSSASAARVAINKTTIVSVIAVLVSCNIVINSVLCSGVCARQNSNYDFLLDLHFALSSDTAYQRSFRLF